MSDLTTPSVETTERTGWMNSLRRVVRVVYGPAQVFGELDRRPDWLVPLIICVLVAAIGSWILLPTVILPAQREVLESRGLTEEQLEAARPWLEGSRPLYVGLATAVVFTALGLVVVAGILYLICAMLLGGDANFVRTFAVIVYSSVIVVPESLVKIPIQLITKSAEAHTSLALILSSPGASSVFAYRFLYRFLDQVSDMFAIWKFILVAVGISVMFKFPRRKSYYVVGALWLIWALGVAVVSGLTHRPTG
ncbi:MAG: YIP1 family protein [Candidatus Eisenbacteria bacterium]|nr:YIP1 family protein [Candidatus Eisenbacteria bacterium]